MPSNTEIDIAGAIVGCTCRDCADMRSRHGAAMQRNGQPETLQQILARVDAARVVNDGLDAEATETPIATDAVGTCDACGADLVIGRNDPVRVVASRTSHATETYGQACCLGGRIRTARCYITEELTRTRAMIYVTDLDRWVHASYRGDFYYCNHDDTYYENRENAPDYNNDPEVEDNGLLYYSTNVLDHCQYDAIGSRLVFGVELEMESSETGVEPMVRKIGGPVQQRYILKSDGSLLDGIELVTVPLTLAEHTGGKLDWAKTLQPFRQAGFVSGSTTTCGIHVHVNRKALSALTIGKLLVFLNSSKPETHAFVTNVAQRKPTGYCARYPKRVRDGREMSSDKYDALHLLPKTIEFRIFRGNMRPERMLKNLEFVHALCTYMPQCSVAKVEDVTAFLSWLFDNRKQYPNLHAFIIEKNARPAVLRTQDDDDLRETTESEWDLDSSEAA